MKAPYLTRPYTLVDLQMLVDGAKASALDVSSQSFYADKAQLPRVAMACTLLCGNHTVHLGWMWSDL